MLTSSYSAEIVLFGSVIFILLYLYFTRNFNHWKNKNVSFIKPLPFVGNIFNGIMMRHCMGEIFYEIYKKTVTPIVGFFVLDQPCLLIKDPKIIKRILIHDFQYFYDRNILNNKRDDPVTTHTLFIINNPEWRKIRTQITPVFTASKIKVMCKLIENVADELICYLKEQTKDDSIVEMKEVCVKFTVDVISSTAFGVSAHSFTQKNSEFNSIAKKLVNWDDFLTSFRMRCYFLAPNVVKLFRMAFFDPKSIKFLKKSFLNIMENRAASKNSRNDLIDILLEIKKNHEQFLEEDVVVAQALTFFVAGFETSSSTIGFALYELAHHSEIQNKLRREINQICEKQGMNYDSIKEMDYLDICVKEVLRKYPVLPFLDRKCNSKYTIPETGTVIDKGTPVFIPTLALHYDPEYFPEPNVFDPERFSKEKKIDSCTYLPFGDGPRNCLGARFGLLTTKVGLVYILQNFNVKICAQTPKKLKFNPKCLTLSSIDGIRLQLHKI